jgi:DNA (cytosine-5)-methyltransferase 1
MSHPHLGLFPNFLDQLDSLHSVVSMFSGIGGMDLGFLGGFDSLGVAYKRLPFRIVWANDNSPQACKTYRYNLGNDIRCGDVWKYLDTLPKSADVIIGGFPCQDVSINGNRNGLNGNRTSLYRAMVEAVRRVNPKVFVAENVKGLLMKDDEQPLQKILKDFESLGYNVTHKLYLAADYGVPQMRERIFIVGTHKRRRVKKFVHPGPVLSKTEWIAAQDAIGDLAQLPESWETSHVWSKAKVSPEQGNRHIKAHRPADTIRAECHGNIQFHYEQPRRISMREAARFQSFPDSFKFLSKLRETERQVGNAVPPVLAWYIAQAVHDCLTT